MIHICSFSSSVGELSKKDKRNPIKILQALANNPRISTWEMDDDKKYPLWKILEKMELDGLIVSVGCAYPWHKFEITEKGKTIT